MLQSNTISLVTYVEQQKKNSVNHSVTTYKPQRVWLYKMRAKKKQKNFDWKGCGWGEFYYKLLCLIRHQTWNKSLTV